MTNEAMMRTAVISPCRRFRYALTRQWAEGPVALFIMLNPSIADADIDDPTIRRCIGFAKREGCGGLRVENLFAYRATDPNIMFRDAHTAIGGTDAFIEAAALIAKEAGAPVIAAWGADKRAEHRAQAVLANLRALQILPKCLGMTQSGAPRHPLYVKSDAPLIPLMNEATP